MIAKKYIHVSQHIRHFESGVMCLVNAHIRKNPKHKETKMEDPKTSEGTASNEERTGGDVEVVRHEVKKESRPSHVNVNIREAESHYLVSLNHGPTRVFHNVEELLVAIEVEVKRLGGTLGGG